MGMGDFTGKYLRLCVDVQKAFIVEASKYKTVIDQVTISFIFQPYLTEQRLGMPSLTNRQINSPSDTRRPKGKARTFDIPRMHS
jgi:hypothetical protein